jgi:hypothetical protein
MPDVDPLIFSVFLAIFLFNGGVKLAIDQLIGLVTHFKRLKATVHSTYSLEYDKLQTSVRSDGIRPEAFAVNRQPTDQLEYPLTRDLIQLSDEEATLIELALSLAESFQGRRAFQADQIRDIMWSGEPCPKCGHPTVTKNRANLREKRIARRIKLATSHMRQEAQTCYQRQRPDGRV